MKVPAVTVDDMCDFHAKHFPNAPVPGDFFSHQQAHPDSAKCVAEKKPMKEEIVGKEEPEPQHDDDLGYYPDGVKRTLTDDEISVFRHSEVHRLYTQLLEHASEAAERRLAALEEAQAGLNAPSEDEYVPSPHREPEAAVAENVAVEKTVEIVEGDEARQETKQEAMEEITQESKQEATQEDEPEIIQAKNTNQQTAARRSPQVPHDGNARNNGLKKRKRANEADHHTYRRIAREMDDVKAVEVELDY
ncbi:hypothetical protein HDK77DRAFT_79251 [Phyllosticta capitalensis]|uniref:Uncharacterized protein n=1 Tax=Phyllosticta capitalensis TaxID=121624 RepID=A0ABR1YD23_9PEZI